MNSIELNNFYNKYIFLSAKFALQFGYTWLYPREWITPKQWDPIEGKKYDPFVVDSQEDKTVLGKDILEHGMYFPLYVTNDNRVKLGFHRSISLQLINPDKQFLCIRIPDVSDDLLPEPFFWARTYREAFILIKAMPGNMRDDIYEQKIHPSPFLQDKISWEAYLDFMKDSTYFTSKDFEEIHQGMLRDEATRKETFKL